MLCVTARRGGFVGCVGPGIGPSPYFNPSQHRRTASSLYSSCSLRFPRKACLSLCSFPPCRTSMDDTSDPLPLARPSQSFLPPPSPSPSTPGICHGRFSFSFSFPSAPGPPQTWTGTHDRDRWSSRQGDDIGVAAAAAHPTILLFHHSEAISSVCVCQRWSWTCRGSGDDAFQACLALAHARDSSESGTRRLGLRRKTAGGIQARPVTILWHDVVDEEQRHRAEQYRADRVPSPPRRASVVASR